MDRKNISTSAARYLEEFILKVLRENEEFLHSHRDTKETCAEIIWLVNNAIDYVGITVKREKSKEEMVRCAMSFYIYHILVPVSYGIYINLLSGNLSVCFREIRVLLESLAKFYTADLKYSNLSFYEERIKTLEKEMHDKHISITTLMKEMKNNLALENNDFEILWGKLSKEWVHPAGIIKRITDHIVEKSDVPGYALVLPMNYGETEISDIKELRNIVSQLRSLLEIAFKKYCEKVNFK